MVTPVVFDTTLEDKLIRDEESKEMVSIIKGNLVYDAGYLFDWGDFDGMLSKKLYAPKSTDFASNFAAIEELLHTQMEETVLTLS